MVRSLEQVRANVGSKGETVIDARGAGRFAGREKEPRPGVRSGHIPGSVNVPFTQVCGVSSPAVCILLMMMMMMVMSCICHAAGHAYRRPGGPCAWPLLIFGSVHDVIGSKHTGALLGALVTSCPACIPGRVRRGHRCEGAWSVLRRRTMCAGARAAHA